MPLERLALSGKSCSSRSLGPPTTMTGWTLNSTPAVVSRERSRPIGDLSKCSACLYNTCELKITLQVEVTHCACSSREIHGWGGLFLKALDKNERAVLEVRSAESTACAESGASASSSVSRSMMRVASNSCSRERRRKRKASGRLAKCLLTLQPASSTRPGRTVEYLQARYRTYEQHRS